MANPRKSNPHLPSTSPKGANIPGRSSSMHGMFDPLGADDDGRATLRGFAALTHGYRVVRPLRGRLPGEAVRSATRDTTMHRPCGDAARDTTMHRPCGMRPTARRCAGRAGCSPRHDDVPAVRDATHGTTMCRPCGMRPTARRCAGRAGCDPWHDGVSAVRGCGPMGAELFYNRG